MLRKVLDHAENSLVERTVDLAGVLDVMNHVLDVDGKLGHRSGSAPRFSTPVAVVPAVWRWLLVLLLMVWWWLLLLSVPLRIILHAWMLTPMVL